MKKKSWVQHAPFIKKSLVLACSLTVMACSHNDGNSMTDVSGVVIDGYLEQAHVCLDINSNRACDTNEPSAMTNAKGEYTFQAGVSDAKDYRIIAIVNENTRDSDNQNADGTNTTRLTPVVYITPAGQRILTPLTSLVAEQLSTGKVTTSLKETEDKIKTAFGLSADVSLFVDHIKKANAGEMAYKMLHEVAKKVAPQLAHMNDIPEMKTLLAAGMSGMNMGDMSGKMDMDTMSGMNMGNMSGKTDMGNMSGKTDMGDMSGKMNMDTMSGMAHFSAVLEGFDPVDKIDMTTMMAGMSHLTAALEGFDAAVDINMETMRPGMQHLRDVLASFDESAAPSVMDNMAGGMAMGGTAVMPEMTATKEAAASKIVPECPQGQRWYSENEIPGMAAMCM